MTVSHDRGIKIVSHPVKISQVLNKYNNWCKAAKLIALPLTIKIEEFNGKHKKQQEKIFCMFINNSVYFLFKFDYR